MSHCPHDGSQLTILASDQIDPGTVPGFRLEEEIGQGATGLVYKATRIGTSESLAIKILHLSLVGDVEMVQRFKQEAELTSSLSSRHIVGVKEYGLLKDGRPYMVMDYIQGCCVSSIVDEEGAMAPHRALPIFIQVAIGLAHTHEHGIMHRDIKLNNIMLVNNKDDHDLVKIVDFGIAKQWLKSDVDGAVLTLAGAALGSPLYMSPEQCLGRKMDHRTDIYSLGSVMYEMLTGRPIFSGPDPISIMKQHIYEPPLPMDLPISCASAEIEPIVLKALAKNPADRYSSVNELKSDLQFSLYSLQMANPAPLPSAPRAA
jgi:serine/threonine-protein kinase